jgi:phosphatidylserine/phosphatidylglycerophosphate/cardiolipin synthase-like enzyme
MQAYLKLITSAKHELLIANAYFVPTPAIAAALMDAARRCVAIKLLTNSPETNDLPELSIVGRGYYRELLEINSSPEVRSCEAPDGGLQIWEWVGQSGNEPQRFGTMHSKFAVVDRRLSLVGSYNLDPRSERLNSETALVFEERQLAEKLARAIVDQDLDYSRQITRAEADGFADPDDAAYRLRKQLGELFEGQL